MDRKSRARRIRDACKTRPSCSLDPVESRDTYEILIERHRSGSIIVISNRGPDEWLATFADPLRAQSAIDRFVHNAFDFVIDGESYRKPALDSTAPSDEKEIIKPPTSASAHVSSARTRPSRDGAIDVPRRSRLVSRAR
jgi:hypothetical protein